MEKYCLKNEDDLFQIEVDALQAIAPEQFKKIVLECVDEFFDDEIYEHNKRDEEITPTRFRTNEVAFDKVGDLLASLQYDMAHQER
jgi:hypothetical protein